MTDIINESLQRTTECCAVRTCDDVDSRSSGSDPESNDVSGNSGNKSMTEAGNSDNSERDELAKKETKAVLRLRVLVFLVLTATAVAVSVAVYFIGTRAEESQFEAQFEGSAERIMASFEDIINQKVAALGSLALAFTSYASSHNMTWPFVIMRAFPYQAATTLSLSEAMFVGYYPVITQETRAAWEKFAVDNYYQYAIESISYQEKQGIDPFPPGRNPPFLQTREQLEAIHAAYSNGKAQTETSGAETQSLLQANTTLDFSSGMANHIYFLDKAKGVPAYETGPGPYFPIVQGAPIVSTSYLNLNLNHPDSQHFGRLEKCVDEGKIVLTGFDVSPPGDVYSQADPLTPLYALWLSFFNRNETSYEGDPMSNLYIPVFDTFDDNRTAVAVVNAVINWKTYFTHILPENIHGVVVVLTNECAGSYTYEVNGADVKGLGMGDLHDKKYDHLGRLLDFADLDTVSDGTHLGLELNQDGCPYTVRVYPSQTLNDQYSSAGPIIVTCCVAVTFVFTAAMFLFYDRLVERRQRLVLFKAKQSTALVTSLFPKNVRDRLLPDSIDLDGNESSSFLSAKRRVKSFLAGGSGDKHHATMQPIADLFPHATVMFADIAGFTAWASTRDPSQVFVLLQSIYQAFDEIAARRRVFKVETIGDSYVAVAGLPDPQPNHAVIMARFAWECIRKLTEVCKDMERSLGPDTGELEMRFGLHSGPVTAGVLLGDRARFQLFGDTVNVAARMESTGIPSRVQASHATAQLLIKAGKSHWVRPRQDVVVAKGKGVMSTHWIEVNAKADSGGDASSVCTLTQDFEDYLLESHVKHSRLVDWIVELFQEHIKKVVARHESTKTRGGKKTAGQVVFDRPNHSITLDEVAEIIHLPTLDTNAVLASEKKSGSVEIAPGVVQQLRSYVATIASAYRDNPFHNFEHACHVTMAVDKFLRRIVAPDLGDDTYKEADGKIASHLHDYTHGINSDPLTIFAIVFSALIHDVDHRGVSNAQLIKEEEQMANLYRNKSVAEQNSLDISWDLLMSADFPDLRACLFPTKADLLRFRQVIVNVVLATDIFDKELNDLRKARWEKAFSEDAKVQNANYNDLRATIVVEHIIQASDVSHTMQHWHVYRKWNARLFKEMHKAFREGRMGVDPSTFWYKGELGFFDNYIIPLAKKLAECKVFGVSSDECLNYAELNRAEWEERGEQLVSEMLQEIMKENKLDKGEKIYHQPQEAQEQYRFVKVGATVA